MSLASGPVPVLGRIRRVSVDFQCRYTMVSLLQHDSTLRPPRKVLGTAFTIHHLLLHSVGLANIWLRMDSPVTFADAVKTAKSLMDFSLAINTLLCDPTPERLAKTMWTTGALQVLFTLVNFSAPTQKIQRIPYPLGKLRSWMPTTQPLSSLPPLSTGLQEEASCHG
ncbi:hypothetical protein BDV93DRAFT_513874 [Ceratobasidium sp. AG-I]|nr:hypothetical protein BDV93DRAFT_513874 [Ceratobasidium sp. AG-I]